MGDINTEIDNIGSEYASATGEDRSDIEENLSDLVEHVEGGNTTLVQQDLATIDRNAESVASDAADVGQAAWDGLRQGLSNCIG